MTKNEDAFRDEAMKSFGHQPPVHEAFLAGDGHGRVDVLCRCGQWSDSFPDGVSITKVTQAWAQHVMAPAPTPTSTKAIPPDGGPPLES